MRTPLLRLLIPALLLLLAGCAGGGSLLGSFRPPSGVSAKTSPELAGRPLKRIAVLPFRNESGVPAAGASLAGIFYKGLSASPRYEVEPPPKLDEDEELKFEFRLRGGRPVGVRNREEDARWLRQQVSRFISTVRPYLTNLELIYPGEYFEGGVGAGEGGALKGTVARSAPGGGGEEPALDAFLTGVVTRYRNRSGGELLGREGAHVAYSVYLVGAKDGKILWEATFNEEQIYLLDNLLLLPRYAKAGFIWQTSDMLARNGLRRVLKTFPGWNRPPPERGNTAP